MIESMKSALFRFSHNPDKDSQNDKHPDAA